MNLAQKETVKRVKAASSGNTMQSVLPVLIICVALSVLGRTWPEYLDATITTTCTTGAVTCVGVLLVRYAKATFAK